MTVGPPRIKPRDLCTNASDFHPEIGDALFNWRNFQRGQETYRLVTIETVQGVVGLNYPVVNLLLPRHLKALPEDTRE